MTNLYYVAPNQWTADPEIDREQMTGMEVVLRYDDAFCDLLLPLPKP